MDELREILILACLGEVGWRERAEAALGDDYPGHGSMWRGLEAAAVRAMNDGSCDEWGCEFLSSVVRTNIRPCRPMSAKQASVFFRLTGETAPSR